MGRAPCVLLIGVPRDLSNAIACSICIDVCFDLYVYQVFSALQVDRLYGWKTVKDRPIQAALAVQDKQVLQDFEDRLKQVKLELMEQVQPSQTVVPLRACGFRLSGVIPPSTPGLWPGVEGGSGPAVWLAGQAPRTLAIP